MAALAFTRGVDFAHADPDGRDWNLHLLLALRARMLADEQAAAVESGRQFTAILGGFAAMASRGRQELLGQWEKALDRLTGALLGLTPDESEPKAPAGGSLDELKAQYLARFGVVDEEYDTRVADWIRRGGDLRGEPMPQRPEATARA